MLAETYINEHISVCPICKSAEVNWTFTHFTFMQDKKVHCTCANCNCVLSIDYTDMPGVNGNSLNEFLKGAASYEKMVRAIYKKKPGVTYVRILEAGKCNEAQDIIGKEIPLDELRSRLFNSENM